MKQPPDKTNTPFTAKEKAVILILALTQFTVILDFMVMSPLGDMLMKSMSLQPKQFGIAVSAYAFSAGISGLLTAGFADRFDRKKLLLFFYTGFILGTVLCGLAHTYPLLVAARVITGLFGGVIGSIGMAIITDLFTLQQRGRVMSFVQMGLGASQVLGIPISLYIANIWGWQAPFLMVAGLAVVVACFSMLRLPAVNEHLALQKTHSAVRHLINTVEKKNYRIAFMATAILSIGGFMMMPFGSAYAINNLHVSAHQLPLLFMISGVSTFIIMPLTGKLADRMDKYKLFVMATIWMAGIIVIYTHLPIVPFPFVVAMNILMTMGIMSRMIPSMTLLSGVPEAADRGAFMSVNSSLQQIAGGIAAAFAGMVVVQKTKTSPLEHYDTLGFIIVGICAVSILLMYRVDRMVKRKAAAQQVAMPTKEEEPLIIPEV
ncbi:MAG: MFS transporter [Sphingobacteriales bacterium]|nr:MAG: MFS transporter [Sphingobacteriales bacterium]